MPQSVVKPFFLDLTEDEIAELQSCLAEILLSGNLILGHFTEQFEDEFARYVGCRYAISLNSGTSALETLLRIHGAQGKQVGVPTNTNFATPAAIIRAGGNPVFLDMTPETFMPDLRILQAAYDQNELSGVVWVHIGGLISPDFVRVAEFCRKNGLFLIEDAAHAHGSRMAEKHAGTFGDGGAFSFFPTKVMTTFEGGMIATDDAEVASLAKSYRNQGKPANQKFGCEHHVLGNSWRMLEISAAMGLIQLRKLDEMVARRTKAASAFKEGLYNAGISYCDFGHMDSASNYKFIIRYDEDASVDEMKSRFQAEGVILGAGVYEKPCHQQPVFADIPIPPQGLPVAEALCPKHICPPLTSGMTDSDVERVVLALKKCLPFRN